MNPRPQDDVRTPAGATPSGLSPSHGAHPGGPADTSHELDMQVRKVPESVLDDAVEATFPASDPVAVVSTKTLPADDAATGENRDQDRPR